MIKKDLLPRKILTPVLLFSVILSVALVLHAGFSAYIREQRTVEDYANFRMKSLTLDLDIKTKSTESVLMALSHLGDFDLSDTASIFRELSHIVAEDNFISNMCLEVWDPDNVGPDAINTLYYVGRDSLDHIGRRCLRLREGDTNPTDLAGYREAHSTGKSTWSQPYPDSLFCKAPVMTCYKTFEEEGRVLSADLELSTLLEKIDSLQIYESSTMCVKTADGEAYTLYDGRICCVTGVDYGPEDNILFSVDYPTLDLEILSVVPKAEVYTYMWDAVMVAFAVLSFILLALAVLMSRSLHKAQDNLTASARKEAEEEMALKKIEEDLAVAARLQTRLLTSPGRGVHLTAEGCRPADIMSNIIPAREVGGDLYEYRLIGHHLLLCVCDVSGKGIPASVVMTMCCTLFHSYQCEGQEPDPAKVMSYMNVQLCRDNGEMMFATMWMGALDLRDGSLKYASAGHNPPVLLSGGGASLLKAPVGTPLGLFEDAVYRTSQCTLTPDDAILLYTDGITEAENMQHSLFGEKALLEVCAGVHPNCPQLVCHSVLSAVRKHSAGSPQSDDITLMCLAFDGRFAQMNCLEDTLELHTLVEECGGGCRTALALEELAVNAFNYGGAGCVRANFRDGIYTLVDDGAAFDPTAFVPASKPEDDDELSIGGRGIDLVRKVSSLFTWQRDGDYNITRLKINELQ